MPEVVPPNPRSRTRPVLPLPRVLVVDEPETAAELARLGRGRMLVRHGPGLLAALAEMGCEAIDGVVLPARALRGDAAPAAEAMRSLRDQLRVVITLEPEVAVEEIASLKAAGFELFVEVEEGPAGLLEALFDGAEATKPPEPEHEPSVDREVDGDGQADPAEVAELNPRATAPRPAASEVLPGAAVTTEYERMDDLPEAGSPDAPLQGPVDSSREDPTAEAPPAESAPVDHVGAGEASSNPSSDPDDLLGDTDLVERILMLGQAGGGETCVDAALRLIEQQSSLRGLRLEPMTPRRPGVAAAPFAEVRHRDQTLGRLHADSDVGSDGRVSAADLSDWAAWLGPWVALERQTLRLQELAMRDELTGAWNRRYFHRFLRAIVDRAADTRSQVSVMLFDVDDFKAFNDTIGHACGDEVLRETVRLMQSVVREHDVVSRIGGDEFAVVFWDKGHTRREGSSHPGDVLRIARRFQRQITDLHFPRLAQHHMPTLTISAGLATFPWDGTTPEELVEKADQMALASKRKGKNALTLGRDAMRAAAQAEAEQASEDRS